MQISATVKTQSQTFLPPDLDKMFESRLARVKILKMLIEAIKELVDSCNFDCNDEGVSLQAMDASHVALVALTLKADGFDHYRSDTPSSLGLSLASLSKVLKCSSVDDMVTLRSDDNSDALEIRFENASLSFKHCCQFSHECVSEQSRLSQFAVKLMDIDAEQFTIPDAEYKCTVTMKSAEFKRICSDMATVGDSMKITANSEGITFSVSGDVGHGSTVLRPSGTVDDDDDAQVTIKVDDEVTQNFSLRFLVNFAKSTPLSSKVTIKMDPETPILVEYPIEDVDGDRITQLGYLRFFLAPKMQDDDEA